MKINISSGLLDVFLKLDFVLHICLSAFQIIYFALIQILLSLMTDGTAQVPPLPDFNQVHIYGPITITGAFITFAKASSQHLTHIGVMMMRGLLTSMNNRNDSPFDINTGFNPFALLFRLICFTAALCLLAGYAFVLMPINLLMAVLRSKAREALRGDIEHEY